MKNKDRIEILRAAALTTTVSYEALYFDFCLRYDSNQTLESEEARYADAYAYALEHARPVIDDGELIVGKSAHFLTKDKQAELKALKSYQERQQMRGQDSHMAVDYELLLTEGTSGVAKRIENYLSNTYDPQKRRFYECALRCLQAVETLSEHYGEYAEKLAKNCQDEARKTELCEIGKICKRVPKYPAKSFHEAVQSVAFLAYILGFDPCLCRNSTQYNLGRPDRYLLPYYEKDIKAKKIDKEYAQLLIDCLAIQINNRVQSGLSSGYMLGGKNEQGLTVSNDLTEMFMQAVDDVRLVFPSVGLCVTEDTEERYLIKACEILSHGRTHPAIFNDDVISEGLKLYGVTDAESHNYVHSNCVEITPIAASYAWVASPYINTLELLLDCLTKEYPDFDALLEEYFRRVDIRVQDGHVYMLAFRKMRLQRCMHPLLSCFVNDCLKRGIDIEKGGAKYGWIMPSFIGIANVVDSLHVIKKLVFESKEFTMAQIKTMLDCNFEGFEPERLKMLNGIDKYGNNIQEVDQLFALLTDKFVKMCETHSRTYADPNGYDRIVPSVFCWTMHERYGRTTGASPDGRKAGFPLGDGSGPCQGREKRGPLASILSSTSWSHKEMIGGVAVNMKFSKKSFNADSHKKMVGLIQSFLQRGGFELQINVVDRETLLDAQIHPEAHRDLIVRIGGYSDYFIRLSPEMQAEVLLRTAHEV